MFLYTHGIISSSGVEPYSNIYSFEYDGINNYINLGNDPSINSDGTSAFSVSTWVKTTTTENFSFIFSKQLNTTPFNGFGLSLKDGDKINLFLGTITSNARIQGYTSSTNVNNGNWHHIALTYDGSQAMSGFTIYLDNSPVAITTTQFNNTPSDCNPSINSSIGVRGEHTGSRNLYFTGNIYDFGYYQSELTSGNISAIYNSGTPNDLNSHSFLPYSYIRPHNGEYSNGVLNEWSIENIGTSTFDAVTENISESERVEDVPPSFNTKSLQFDGVLDYVDFGDSDSLSFGDGTSDSPFSISGWFKVSSISSTQFVIGKRSTSGGSNAHEYLVYIASGGVIGLSIYDGASVNRRGRKSSSGAISVDTWHHVVGTYNGVGGTNAHLGIKIYVDGVQVDSANSNNNTYIAMENEIEPFKIGQLTAGNVDEVSIFSSELSSSDVTSIYTSGEPNDISGMSNLVSWWRMGDNDTYPTIYDNAGSNNGTMNNMTSSDIVNDTP